MTRTAWDKYVDRVWYWLVARHGLSKRNAWLAIGHNALDIARDYIGSVTATGCAENLTRTIERYPEEH